MKVLALANILQFNVNLVTLDALSSLCREATSGFEKKER